MARYSALCLDRQKQRPRQNAKACGAADRAGWPKQRPRQKHLWRGATGVARGRKRGNAKAGVAAKTLWAWRGAAVAIGEGAAFFSQRLGQPQILRLSRKGQNLGFNTTTKTTSATTGTTHCNDNLSAGLPTSGGGGTQGGGQRRSFREEVLGEAKAGSAALAGWKWKGGKWKGGRVEEQVPRQLREWSMPRGREWIRFRFPCPANAGFRGFRGWRGGGSLPL